MKLIVKTTAKPDNIISESIIKLRLEKSILEINKTLFQEGSGVFLESIDFTDDLNRIIGYPKSLPVNMIDWTEEDKEQLVRNKEIIDIRVRIGND